MSHCIRVTVPATSANLGPGFDTLGLALNLRNELHAQVTGKFRSSGESAVSVSIEGIGASVLPVDAGNLAVRSAQKVFERAGKIPERVSYKLLNRIPLCSGLGSSASATVAGLCIANELCGKPFDNTQLLKMAVEIEGHPDNVAPALLGGLTISVVGDDGEIHVLQPRLRTDLHFVCCSPCIEVSTEKARNALPKQYKREDAVYSLSRAVMLTSLLQGGDAKLLHIAMQDKLHQPYRAKLVPAMEAAISSAIEAGAIGACLSGSGPTILAITDRAAKQEPVGRAMQAAFSSAGMQADVLCIDASKAGVRVCHS